MSIRIRCSCGQKLQAPEKLYGKRAKCPKCGKSVTVPPPVSRAATESTKPPPRSSATQTSTRGQPRASADAGQRPPVFISYSKPDRATAETVAAALQEKGIPNWIAPRDISPGADWPAEIMKAINACEIMLLVYSRHSNNSNQVTREVERAVSKHKTVIPFRIEDVELSDSLEYLLSSPQWFDALTQPVEPYAHSLADLLNGKPAHQVYPSVLSPNSKPMGDTGPSFTRLIADHRRLLWAAALAVPCLLVIFLVAVWATLTWQDHAADGVQERLAVGIDHEDEHIYLEPASREEPVEQPPKIPKTTIMPASVNPLESEVELPGGALKLSSSGISVTFRRASESNQVASGDSPLGDNLADRIICLSNNESNSVTPEWNREAEVRLMVTNLSERLVTLSQLELDLLGIAVAFDDCVLPPERPYVVSEIDDLVVDEGAAPKINYANLHQVFKDDDNPPSELTYTLNYGSEVLSEDAKTDQSARRPVTAEIRDDGTLNLRFHAGRAGTQSIRVVATDPFGQSAAEIFKVLVRPRSQPVVAATLPPSNRMITEYRSEVGRPVDRSPFDDSFSIETEATTSGQAAFTIEDEILDLGTLVCSFSLSAPDQLVAPSASGNLLKPGKVEVFKPRFARFISLRIATELSIDLANNTKATDSIIGTNNRRLGVAPPRPTKIAHFFTVTARFADEDGDAHTLYPNRLFVLTSNLANNSSEGATRYHGKLATADSHSPIEFSAAMIRQFIPAYRDTQIYEAAERCGIVPDGFNADEVPASCYFGNSKSPLRQLGSARAGYSVPDGGITFPLARSNLVQGLLLVRSERAAIWKHIDSAIVKLADGNSPYISPSRFQVRHLRNEMSSHPEPRQLIRSVTKLLHP